MKKTNYFTKYLIKDAVDSLKKFKQECIKLLVVNKELSQKGAEDFVKAQSPAFWKKYKTAQEVANLVHRLNRY